MSALGTDNTTEPEAKQTIRSLDRPLIIPMDAETGRASTGTGQLMKLKIIYN